MSETGVSEPVIGVVAPGPQPSYRVKGIVGYKARKVKPAMASVQIQGKAELVPRELMTRASKSASKAYRQWRARRRERCAKQARKLNRRNRGSSHPDYRRLRGKKNGRPPKLKVTEASKTEGVVDPVDARPDSHESGKS